MFQLVAEKCKVYQKNHTEQTIDIFICCTTTNTNLLTQLSGFNEPQKSLSLQFSLLLGLKIFWGTSDINNLILSPGSTVFPPG